MNNYNQEEEYLLSESDELSLTQTQKWINKLFYAFPAFSHRNYRLYFIGLLVSLSGLWIRQVTVSWYVLQVTRSAFWVGVFAALTTLPVFLFSLVAGVLVDRFKIKNLLMSVQVASTVLILIIGILAVTGTLNLWILAILVFILGSIDVLDKPARQSYAVQLVGKEDLASAIALNSGIFNGARIIGPAVAAGVIFAWGVGPSFLVNSFAYIPAIIALKMITTQEKKKTIHHDFITAIRKGLEYSWTHSVIRRLLVFVGLTSIFGWSYTTILPFIAKDVFHSEVDVYGAFLSVSALGALCGIVLVSYYSRKVNPLKIMILGNFIFCLFMVCFSLTQNLFLAYITLFLAGAGLMMQVSMINNMIQHLVEDSIRGRVMSIYVLMQVGVSPLGSFQVGAVTEQFGSSIAIQIGALALFLYGLFIYFSRKKTMLQYHTHIKNKVE